jgi:hypothetical protein
MSEKMIEIKGRKFSEETIAEALQKLCNFEPEKSYQYQFQKGDVAKNKYGDYRIICGSDYVGSLIAIDMKGRCQARSQVEFERCGYRKIGILSDFIKDDC